MTDKPREAVCGCTLLRDCGSVMWMNDKIAAYVKGNRKDTPPSRLLTTMLLYAHKECAYFQIADNWDRNTREEVLQGIALRVGLAMELYRDWWEKNKEIIGRTMPSENNRSIIHRCLCGTWNDQGKQFCPTCSRTVPVIPTGVWGALAEIQTKTKKKGNDQCQATPPNA